MSEKPMCKGKTWDGYGYLHCSRRATLPTGYCKIHDPETVAAKRKARNERWKAERQETLKKYAEEKKVQEFREHAAKHYDAMLAALKDANAEIYDMCHSEGDPNDVSMKTTAACLYRCLRDVIAAAEKDVTP